MGKIEIDHTGSGSGVTISSDGTDLLLDGTAIGGGGSPDLYAENYDGTSTLPSATGTNAVAIGGATVSGNYSLAAGYLALARGTRSFSGPYSHAFGNDATAFSLGSNSTSYGAIGSNSVAIGHNAKATSAWSTAIGYSAAATGQGSFSAGYLNTASGSHSVAMGQSSDATQANSIAIGDNASSTTANLIALGGTTDTVQISGAYTLPATDGTANQVLTTDGSGAVTFADAGGGGFDADFTLDDKTANYTIVAADAGKIITHSSNNITLSLTAAATLGAGFHVWIKNRGAANSVTTIDPDGTETVDGRGIVYLYTGESTHLYTDGTNWYAVDCTIMFAGNTATDYYAPPTAAGGGSIAAGLQATANGSDAAAYGYTASAGGSKSLAIGADASATTTRAAAIGWSRAGGTESLAINIGNSSTSYGATGTNSVAMGYQAKATSTQSFAAGGWRPEATAQQSTALGSFARASGTGSMALSTEISGWYTTASGSQAVAIGNRTVASGSGSYALGYQSNSNISNKYAFAGGQFTAVGDAQTGTFVLRSDTTDATATQLTTNNGAAATTNQIILPNNSAYAFHGTIVARQQASQGTACAAWKVEGLIRREGSAGTTVLVNSATTVLDNTPAWGMALSADTTNGGLKIEVTGAAATNIRWVATINTSEVTY